MTFFFLDNQIQMKKLKDIIMNINFDKNADKTCFNINFDKKIPIKTCFDKRNF